MQSSIKVRTMKALTLIILCVVCAVCRSEPIFNVFGDAVGSLTNVANPLTNVVNPSGSNFNLMAICDKIGGFLCPLSSLCGNRCPLMMITSFIVNVGFNLCFKFIPLAVQPVVKPFFELITPLDLSTQSTVRIKSVLNAIILRFYFQPYATSLFLTCKENMNSNVEYQLEQGQTYGSLEEFYGQLPGCFGVKCQVPTFVSCCHTSGQPKSPYQCKIISKFW